MKSPINWVGGKSKLVETLIPLIPNHKGYVEVFGGALYLFFSKEQSKWEVVNDFDSELMNFWKVVQNNHEEFIDSFKYTLHSRETFNEYKEIFLNKIETNPIKKAHIFYYLVITGFGADMKHPSFGTSKGLSKFNPLIVEENITLAHTRLARVTIDNDDFKNIIDRYDSVDTFFYLDPPYRKTKGYRVKFTDEDYIALHEKCQKIQGKFLISINNDDFIRDLFSDFNIVDIDVQYSLCRTDNGRRKFGELLISNYPLNL